MRIQFEVAYVVTAKLDGSKIDHHGYSTVPVEVEIAEVSGEEMIHAFSVHQGPESTHREFPKDDTEIWRLGDALYQELGVVSTDGSLLPAPGSCLQSGTALGIPDPPVYIPGHGLQAHLRSLPPISQIGHASSRSSRDRQITEIVSDNPIGAVLEVSRAAAQLLLVDGKLMVRCQEPIYETFMSSNLHVIGFSPAEEVGHLFSDWSYYAADSQLSDLLKEATSSTRITVHNPASVRFDAGSAVMRSAPAEAMGTLALWVEDLSIECIDRWCRLRDAVRDPIVRRSPQIVDLMRDLRVALQNDPAVALSARTNDTLRRSLDHMQRALHLWDTSQEQGRRWWRDAVCFKTSPEGMTEIIDAVGLTPLLQHFEGSQLQRIQQQVRSGSIRAFTAGTDQGNEIVLMQGDDMVRYPVRGAEQAFNGAYQVADQTSLALGDESAVLPDQGVRL